MAPFARRHLWCICAAVSVESPCVVARFARRHLWGICAAVSVGSQCVVARFARRHLLGICAAVSVGSQCVVVRFARRPLSGICAAVSVGSQYVLARFARRYFWGICATVSVGSQCVVARFARRKLWGICAAVSVGSQCVVLALILLVFVHHYYRARRLGYCVLPLEPPGTTGTVVQYSRPHTSPFDRGIVNLPFVPKCSVGHYPISDVHRYRRCCFSAHIRESVDGIYGWLESLLEEILSARPVPQNFFWQHEEHHSEGKNVTGDKFSGATNVLRGTPQGAVVAAVCRGEGYWARGCMLSYMLGV